MSWAHIYGSQTPVQVANYPLLLVYHTMRDMGIPAEDVRITASLTAYSSNGIVPAVYEALLEAAGTDHQDWLESLHSFDANYSIYWLKEGLSEEENRQLREIYVEAGLIPTTEEDALIIDLTRVREQVVF